MVGASQKPQLGFEDCLLAVIKREFGKDHGCRKGNREERPRPFLASGANPTRDMCCSPLQFATFEPLATRMRSTMSA
jgi:hypothetical protein